MGGLHREEEPRGCRAPWAGSQVSPGTDRAWRGSMGRWNLEEAGSYGMAGSP
jgi:hypothetical protein